MMAQNSGRVGRLPFRRKWSVYLISSGVWLTGTVWVSLHYFLTTIDKYGFAKARPSEHYVLIAHAAFGVGAVWLFGVLWPIHVTTAWRVHIRRLSGGTLFGFTAWLTLTGFLLYYVGSDKWRSIASIGHWAIGLAGVVPFAVHLLTRKRISSPRNSLWPTAGSAPDTDPAIPIVEKR